MSCSGPALVHLASSFVGAHEDPPGSNTQPRVDAAIGTRTVRNGKWIDVKGLEWCARFASGMAWLCAGGVDRALSWTPEAYRAGAEPLPFGMRAAVSELVADAVASGAWRSRESGYVPSPGDLAVFRRGGHDPTTGGLGHVAIVEQFAGPPYVTVGGNESDEVRMTQRDLTKETDGNELVGWIASGLSQAPSVPGKIPSAAVAGLSMAAVVTLLVGVGAGWFVARKVALG